MKERLSALMDDALEDSSVASVLDGVRRDEEALRTWDVYHLIGDSLRGEAGPHGNVAERVIQNLEVQPTVLAPIPSRSAPSLRLRWVLPLAASFMGVAAVAWVAQTVNAPATPEPLARTAQALTVAATAGPAVAPVLPRESSVPSAAAIVPVQTQFGREYLIAHQAYSPGASMSGVAQYVRTVSESRNEPAR